MEFIDRVKKHFRDHEEAYVYSAITGVVVAAVTAVVVIAKYGKPVTVVLNDTDAEVANVVNGDIGKFYQRISMYGNPLGRPGTPVIDTTTGDVFKSIKLAADAYDVEYRDMRRHLDKKITDFNGHVFELAV